MSERSQRVRSSSADNLPALAVVPFATGFDVPHYLGVALAEKLINKIGNQNSGIAVVAARDSTLALARRGLEPRAIGAALHTDFVLTGALYRKRKQARIRAAMMRTADGSELWIEDFLLETDSIAALASELATRVAVRLHGPHFVIRFRLEQFHESHVAEAAELHHRAHHEWHSLERHRMQDATDLLSRAIELDPSFVGARVCFANLCVAQSFYGFVSPQIAATMIRKKAAADDAPPDVLLPALGWISFHVDHDLTSALRAFARAAHLPPDSWRCRNRNTLAVSRHRFDEALDGLQQGIAADPYSSWLRARRAWVLHLAGQAGASVDQVRENLEMFSGENGILAYAAIILAYNGETAEAVELARGLADRSPHYDVASAVLAYALACAGRPSEAIALLDRLQWLGRERYALRSFNAAAYLALGEPERAMEELRASLESRCPWFFQTLADPRLAPLRTRPDFREMLATLSRMESEAAGAGLQ